MPFDDDDSPLAPPLTQSHGHSFEESAEDGDGMTDFSLFSSVFSKRGVSSKVIRKGEKDFESHGTRAQDSTLENSRNALEDVLSYTRIHRGDAWIRAWYFPDHWVEGGDVTSNRTDGLSASERVVVLEHEKGGWLKDTGRIITGPDKSRPGVGRSWLLPEEALHLLERGTVDIWWPDRELEELLPASTKGNSKSSQSADPDDYDVGIPLSLEAGYALLIGEDGERGKISLPKYQVYAHLRRSGFIVLRAPQQNDADTTKPPTAASYTTFRSIAHWLSSLIHKPTTAETATWGPLVQPGLYRAYRPIYERLAILPRHKPDAVTSVEGSGPTQECTAAAEPFKVFYHVWKPGAPNFSKKTPPPPDFRIAVTDTSDSGVPSLQQIDALLQTTPPDPPRAEWANIPGRMHQRLKHGYRNVLVAVVDRGLVNFMRFGDGCFGEEKVYERFDGGQKMRGGKGGRGRGRGGGRGGRGRGRGSGRGG